MAFLPFLEFGPNPRKSEELAQPQTKADYLCWLLSYELKLHNGNLGPSGLHVTVALLWF